MSAASHACETCNTVSIEGAIEWTCLGRALVPRLAPSADATLTLAFRLSGQPDRLHGRVTVSIIEHGEAGAIGGSTAVGRTLLERPTRATLAEGPWTAIEIRTDGGPSADILVRPDAEGGGNASGGIGYVRTDLPVLLGLEGGRYGGPRVRIRVTAASPDPAAQPAS